MSLRPRNTDAPVRVVNIRPGRRAVKAVLWVVFAGLIALSFSFGTPHASSSSSAASAISTSSPSSATAPSTTTAAQVVQYLAAGKTTTTLKTTKKPVTTTTLGLGAVKAPTPPAGCSAIALNAGLSGSLLSSIDTSSYLPLNYTAGSGACSSQSQINQLLPLNRWNSAATDMTVGPAGVNPVASSITDALSAIATVLFSMSSFIWTLIFDVMQFALTHDLVLGAANAINSGFSAISGAILGSGLIVVLIFLTIIGIALGLLRNNSKVKVFSTILAMIIPIAAIQALATLADNGSAAASPGTTAPITVGSPAWIAVEGLNMADQLASGIASSVPTVTMGSQLQTANSQLPPGCAAYVEVLYADYASAQTAAAQTENGQSATGTTTLAAISALWESGYLANWINAEFSSGPDGASMFCHYLDATYAAGVSQYEQRAIDTQAYGAAAGLGNSAAYLPTLSIDPVSVGFKENSVMFGFAACVHNGSWSVATSWYALAKADSSWKLNDAACEAWATKIGNYGASNQSPKGFSALSWTTNSDLANDYANSPDQGNAVSAFNTANTYGGNGAGASRILAGLISLVTALAYGWALLGIGIGSIVAQLGLIAMMIMLPATLFLLAMPRKTNNGKSLGGKLLRMTAGFFACRLIVTVVLVVLVYLTLTLSSIISPGTYTTTNPTTTTTSIPASTGG